MPARTTGPATRIKAGFQFTHKHMYDPAWVPGPGEKWRTHAPKARMQVVMVTREGSVWYGYARDDGGRVKGSWVMGLDKFEAEYGDQA